MPNTPELFDSYYFAHCCGRPYQRDEWWLAFFDRIAERIVADFQPATVLDAGCGLGFLVEGLRRRGVEAYGFDISAYAIQHVHESVRAYCWHGSVLDALQQRYDLIVSIEVLEHMPQPDAEAAVANLSRFADRILFSSSPSDFAEATHFNVQPPEYWAAQFARHGLYRDTAVDAGYITPWAVCFARRAEPLWQLVAGYERRLWQHKQDADAQRDLNVRQREELARLEAANTAFAAMPEELRQARRRLEEQQQEVTILQQRQAQLEASFGWSLLRRLQSLRAAAAPPASTRDQAIESILQGLLRRDPARFPEAMQLIGADLRRRLRPQPRKALPAPSQVRTAQPAQRLPVQPHTVTADIIVCVHNAPEHARQCLEAVVQHTQPPYRIIIVDDASEPETQALLDAFAAHQPGTVLIRNAAARGYTLAANQGLRRSDAEVVVLLNSDTIVTSGWLDRLITCAESDPQIGMTGPLSNTASWQSIPEVEANGDWAPNPLPAGVTAEAMGDLVARRSARLYPAMPFLNGFCLLLTRRLIAAIGYFDEETFGAGYGEENDYCLRARAAGFQLALADDAYVYHAQSASYSDERRRALVEQAGTALAAKHGQANIDIGVRYCRSDRVLEGIRAHSRLMLEREEWIRLGRTEFAGRRVLFLLPVGDPGGGASVVMQLAQTMRGMGVAAEIFNLSIFRSGFESADFPGDVPVTFGDTADLPALAQQYDALVATAFSTVAWLAPVAERRPAARLGYFIQDFEPYFYIAYSPEYKAAWRSYDCFAPLIRVTTTRWLRDEVKRQIGVESAVIGPVVDLDAFRPRPRASEGSGQPLRIAAMVRPESPRRSPEFTMEVLRRIGQRFGRRVEIQVFGAEPDNPAFLRMPHDFEFQVVGRLGRSQVTRFISDLDIFADFSAYQAMGLTALEAMASGVATIVPVTGGANSYARNGENCLSVDTASVDACETALRAFIEDDVLRERLRQRALRDACAFHGEGPAYRMLAALFQTPAIS